MKRCGARYGRNLTCKRLPHEHGKHANRLTVSELRRVYLARRRR